MKVDCASHGVSVTATGAVAKRCPYKDESDTGSVTITWLTDGQTFELHQLRALLDGLAGESMSHEDYTQHLADLLHAEVESSWTTAHMEVQVSALPSEPLRA